MEGRIRHISLSCTAVLLVWGGAQYAAAATTVEPMTNDTEQVIQPQVARTQAKEAHIDAEDFEIGAFAGMLSAEDFGVNPVFGLRIAYHVSEDYFVEAALGQSKTSKTSYERLSGSAELLTSNERLLRYYDLSVGYNLLPGEAFIKDKYAFNTALYIIGGIGSTHFAGSDRFTLSFGGGYRFLATDWLAIHGDLRDLMFDMDLFGSSQVTNNIEMSLGATIFF